MIFKLRFFLAIMFLFSVGIQAQERVIKNGRIIAKYFDLNDVAIQNVSLNKTVYSEKGGYFKLPIAVNDTVVFSSENFKPIYIVVTPSDIQSRFLYISLEPNENTLEELVIDGTLKRSAYLDAKKRKAGVYKKLHTATSGGPISQLINLLSGRTKMLKKAIELEEQNDMAERMISSMSESYFIDELKIPKEYIGGFGYFLLDDYDVVEAVKRRNSYQLQFLLPLKAKMYLEMIKEYQQ
ncbi:hypothetical protein [Flavobacterium sp. I3-2]|uniref:hypothetical protein n=1 Tax=Flavobacterium sp. I3-2 TaxID=2748319 RepID=UPI0015A77C8B|nr:hypothetical protein [Flavobacterium sp. I3-2]